MAINGARADSLRRALVPAVLAPVPRCRRAARRAGPGGGAHDNLDGFIKLTEPRQDSPKNEWSFASSLSNRKKPGCGGVDDGALSDDDDRLGTSSEWDRGLRENVVYVLLI